MAHTSCRLSQLATCSLAGGMLILLAACANAGSVGPTVISGRLAYPQGTGNIPCASVLPTWTVTPPDAGHMIYNRTAIGPLPLQKTFHAGATISYEWCAYPENPQPSDTNGQSDARIPETLKTVLYGPYSTRSDAVATEMTMVEPPHDVASTPPPVWPPNPTPPTPLPTPAPAVAGPPAQTDTWSGETVVTSVALPRTLAPGWYISASTITPGASPPAFPGAPGSHSGGQFQVIQVLAP